MCSIQPLDFELKDGMKIGYTPDRNFGMANDNEYIGDNLFLIAVRNSIACTPGGKLCLGLQLLLQLPLMVLTKSKLYEDAPFITLVNSSAAAYTKNQLGTYTKQNANITSAAIAGGNAGTVNYYIGGGVNITLINSPANQIAVGTSSKFRI